MLLFWTDLIKWIVMKQQSIMFKGKDTFFLTNCHKFPCMPSFFFFLFTWFFSVVTYLLRIHTFARVFWKTWKICWQKVQMDSRLWSEFTCRYYHFACRVGIFLLLVWVWVGRQLSWQFWELSSSVPTGLQEHWSF